MKEYIERVTALNALIRALGYCQCANDVITRIPAADVAEVRHGRWDASDRYKFLDGSTCIRCTECGAALHLEEYQKYHWHYCPNCGARMDEEADLNEAIEKYLKIKEGGQHGQAENLRGAGG